MYNNITYILCCERSYIRMVFLFSTRKSYYILKWVLNVWSPLFGTSALTHKRIHHTIIIVYIIILYLMQRTCIYSCIECIVHVNNYKFQYLYFIQCIFCAVYIIGTYTILCLRVLIILITECYIIIMREHKIRISYLYIIIYIQVYDNLQYQALRMKIIIIK